MADNKNENNQAPRQSKIGLFLPFILIAAMIGFFIWAITSMTTGNVTTFTQSNISELLDTSKNLVKNAEVYEYTNVTTINGYYTTDVTGSGIPAKTEKYTVTVSNYTFHTTYEAQFISSIDAFKTKFNNVDRAECYLVAKNAFETNWFETWGPTLIITIGTALIAIFLFSRLSKSVGGANNKALDFNRSRARRIDTSKVRFTDVAGCDEEKAEMVELVDYLKDPKKYSKFGAKLPKGVLLVGNPGCGKTLLAKAVAGEAQVPFYSISGSDFVEMFVGVGAGRVRDMFKKAKETAPCLIFIDEIDAVGRQRGAGLGGGNDEREQTLNQLLVEMDGFSDNAGIIVIAATNRDDVLDPALLRAGRFDRKITVNLPDRKGREEIFKVHARNKVIAKEVDFENLSKRTVGFSGADIESILNDAAILAVRRNETEISLADIDEAIDRRIAGPAKSSKALNAEERKRIAYHEAGHAIIGIKLPHSDKVQKITIIPRGRTGGHVLMTPEDDRFLLSEAELKARIVGFLGGRTSEEIFFDSVSTGASNDIEVATRIARAMVTEYGMSRLGPIQYERDTGSVFLGRDYTSTQRNFSTQVAYEIDTAVREIVDEAHEMAASIITKYKKEVSLIAEELLKNETITAEQIDAVLNGGKEKKVTKKAPAKKAPAKKPSAKKVTKKVDTEPVIEEKVESKPEPEANTEAKGKE